MAIHNACVVRNRLLTALTSEDFDLLSPKLERMRLTIGEVLIEPHQPILFVHFPESGLVSTLADTDEGRIEIGMIGRDGMSGIPVVLGASRTPHVYVVQGAGDALRIRTRDLLDAIRERPAIFRPLGLYAQALMVQMGQTVYANATFNIEARLARWILMMQDRSDGDELLLTHEFLAAMLGVRRPGVTTATHALEGMGSIRNRRGRIEVLDREKLLEMAGDAYQAAETEYERLMAGV